MRDTCGEHACNRPSFANMTLPQTRTRRVAEQPPPAQHYEGRTVRHWVRHDTEPRRIACDGTYNYGWSGC